MRVSQNFVLREIAGDILLIPVGQTELRGMIQLDPLSRLIYQAAQAGREPEEILRQILAEYEVEEGRAREDLDAALTKMREIGILEP